MNISQEKVSEIKTKLTVAISIDQILKTKENVVQRISLKSKIPGFRPGKAPRNVLEAHYGPMIEEETVNEVIKLTYPEVIKERSLEVVGYPSIQVLSYDPSKELKYEATVELYPELNLKKYSGFEIKDLNVEIDDQEVSKNIKNVLEQYCILKDRPENHEIVLGDMVTMDYHGKFLDGTAFEGGHAHDAQLEIGSQKFIPGFEDKLIGHKLGDNFTFNITFPEKYHAENLKSKEVTFEIDIKKIEEKIYPDFNDEICTKLGVRSEDEFKKEIRESLESQKKEQRARSLKAQVLDHLVQSNPFEVPEFLVKTQAQHMIKDAMSDIKSRSPQVTDAQLENYFRSQSDMYKKQAEEIVKSALILEELAKKEKIEVTEQDLNEKFAEFSKQFNQTEEQIRNFYNNKNKNALTRLNETIKEDKIIKFILDRSTIRT